MLRIHRDLLDQQIIESTAAKWSASTTSTMNIHHDGVRDTLLVVDIDIGVRSILRRLFQGVLPPAAIRQSAASIRRIPSAGTLPT